MDKAQLLELLDVGPVIASVKDEAGLSAALKSDVGVIFLLFGDVLNIGEMAVSYTHLPAMERPGILAGRAEI